MKKKKTSWLPYILIGAAVIAALAIAFGRKKGDNATRVVVETAAKRTIVEKVAASGKVFPEVEVEMTSNVSGTIVELAVQEGQNVKAGQLLARIDPEALTSVVERAEAATNGARAQLESVRAQKEQLQAQFRNTKITYDRNKQLFEQGVISKAEMDASQAAFETAQANLQAADQNILAAQFSVRSSEATVREQRKNLSQTSIYAPMDGVVSKVNKKKGEQVVGTNQMAGTTILKIANLNSVEVRVDVNERDILNVSIGDTADVELDAYPNRKFVGIVTQIANTASNVTALTALSTDQVTNFEVRIRLDPAAYTDLLRNDGRSPFRAGLSASAEIRTNTLDNILTVPVAAVTARADTSEKAKQDKNAPMLEYVFVQQGDSVVMKPVKSGVQDDSHIEILSGLTGSETVVKAPYEAISKKLKDGSKIKVVTENELYENKGNFSAPASGGN